MKAEFYVENRRRFFDLMEDDSIAVFFSGNLRRDTSDQIAYPFSVDRNFYYLTGLDRDGFVLILMKAGELRIEQLFIPPIDPHFERWEAKMVRPEEATAVSGIKDVLYSYQFDSEFSKKIFSPTVCKNAYIFTGIAEMHEPLTLAQTFASKIAELFPSLRIRNSLPLMLELRSTKTTEEVEEISQAVNLAGDAMIHAAKLLQPGIWEYQISAHYAHYLNMHGSKPRFRSVIAAAGNATLLHYNLGSYQCQDGDLVLMDVGAMNNWYISDITRTFPINGKFNDKQRMVYEIVYEALEIAMGTMRVGIDESVINEAIRDHYFKALKGIGLIKDKDEVENYYMHRSGHPIGLDLHEFRYSRNVITDGCVQTIEPGLYISEWGMGVRIEENVFVTSSGIKNLSEQVPKTINDIENIMK
ncbi:MAG TPA: aminopeptidase P family protein [Clostridiaceae bacterium]|nr:aminopeptidase P family protein [Clostridiaceae bacterium]